MKEGDFIKRIIIAFLLLSLLFLSSCSKNRAETISGFYLDTFCEITLYEDDKEFLEPAMEIIKKYDLLFDPKNPNSDIYKINHSNGDPVDVSPATAKLIGICLEYRSSSNNRYEPLIYTLSSLWKEGHLPDEDLIKSTLSEIKNAEISIKGNTITLFGGEFDPGSSAKGFISGEIEEFLSKNGVKSGIINLGGNVQLIGSKNGNEYSVALKSPFEGQSAYSLSLKDRSISTCGTYERFFEENGKIYHHILDVETGYPKESDLASVTVIGPDPTRTDILSTVCFLLGEADSQSLEEFSNGYEAIFIYSLGKVSVTNGLEFNDGQFKLK